jgi:hypothetical protein
LAQAASRVVALGITLCSVACGPRDSEVVGAFQADNPTFVVLDVASGEGDGDTVYKHIRFTRPGASEECEAVWGYQHAESGWRVSHRGPSYLVGTACEGCTHVPCP